MEITAVDGGDSDLRKTHSYGQGDTTCTELFEGVTRFVQCKILHIHTASVIHF